MSKTSPEFHQDSLPPPEVSRSHATPPQSTTTMLDKSVLVALGVVVGAIMAAIPTLYSKHHHERAQKDNSLTSYNNGFLGGSACVSSKILATPDMTPENALNACRAELLVQMNRIRGK